MNKKLLCVIAGSLFYVSLMTGCAGPQVHQPRMEAALEALKEARAELEIAAPNKGGHREEAIELINHAIEQVKQGIEAGERYGRY